MPHEKENASSKHYGRGNAADDILRPKPFCDGKRNKGKEEREAERGMEEAGWAEIVAADGNVKGFYLVEGIYK